MVLCGPDKVGRDEEEPFVSLRAATNCWRRFQFPLKSLTVEPNPGWGCGHQPGRAVSEAQVPFVTSQWSLFLICVGVCVCFKEILSKK